MDLTIRPRRLRGSEALRKIVRETRVDKSALIYPLFVMDGENRVEEIPSMPGQYRYTVDRVDEELDKLTEKSYETTVPMKLKKVEGEWKVAKMEDDSEFMNAILGRHHQSV